MPLGHVRAIMLALPLAVEACGPARSEARPPMRPEAQQPEQDDDPAAPPPSLDLPGVDISGLSPRERKVLGKVVHELTSPCGDPATLERCVSEGRACKRC